MEDRGLDGTGVGTLEACGDAGGISIGVATVAGVASIQLDPEEPVTSLPLGVMVFMVDGDSVSIIP